MSITKFMKQPSRFKLTKAIKLLIETLSIIQIIPTGIQEG
jgi:hypothetical protein